MTHEERGEEDPSAARPGGVSPDPRVGGVEGRGRQNEEQNDRQQIGRPTSSAVGTLPAFLEGVTFEIRDFSGRHSTERGLAHHT